MSDGMTPEKWRRVAGVMEVTLELERSLRQVYLASIQGQEPEIAEHVRSLLISLNEIEAGDSNATGSTGRPARELSERIGPYRILNVLGQGGMGTVFLAEQREENLVRKVAIKVVHNRYAVTAARQRFLAERQILAHLEHPNIARMYDAGTTPDGRPYLVIEAVDGVPLDLFCDNNHLSIRQRLELFNKVCHAVSYAHGHLVVHRDLKPSNILVNAEHEPKLLDFGIAKILDHNAIGIDSEDLTRTSERPMTPSYASPEQVLGLPITTATDIFALGALLYKIFTGRTPYNYPAQTPEVMAAVQEKAPMAPSQAILEDPEAAPAPVTGKIADLKGDLDNIVLKALARDVALRYRSVAELAEDLERFLNHRPVQATRSSFAYRARKFVSRHRWPVALAALLALSLVVGLLVTGRQASEIRSQRDQLLVEKEHAEREQTRAEDVSGFLVDLFKSAAPSAEMPQRATVGTLLDRASESLDSSLENLPLTEAALHHVLGEILLGLNQFEKARGELEKAVELRRDALPDDHELLVESTILLGAVLVHHEDHENSQALLQEALTRSRGTDSKNEVMALMYLAHLWRFQGNPVEALPFANEAYEISVNGTEISPATVIDAADMLAIVLLTLGRAEQALVPSLKAVETSRQHFGPNHYQTGIVLNTLGAIQMDRGEFANAAKTIRKALEIETAFAGEEANSVTITMMNYGVILGRAGDLEQAVETLSEVVRRFSKAKGPDSADTARGLRLLARAQLELGDLEAAQDNLLRALSIYEEQFGKDSIRIVRVVEFLGQLRLKEKSYESAIVSFDRVIEIIGKQIESDGTITPSSRTMASAAWQDSALAGHALGRQADARRRFESAVELASQPKEEEWNKRLSDIKARSLLFLNRVEDAEPILHRLEQAEYSNQSFKVFCSSEEWKRHCEQVSTLIPKSNS